MHHCSVFISFLICCMTFSSCKQHGLKNHSSANDIKSIKSELAGSSTQPLPNCEPIEQKVSINPYLEPVTDCNSVYYKLFEDIHKQNATRRDVINEKIITEFKNVFHNNDLELLLPTTYGYKELTADFSGTAKKLLAELKITPTANVTEFRYDKLYEAKKDLVNIKFFFSIEPEPVFGIRKNKIVEVKLLKTAKNLDKIIYGSYVLCGPEPALEGACIISPGENFGNSKFFLYVIPTDTVNYEIAPEPIIIENRGFIYDIKFTYQTTPNYNSNLPFTSNTVLGHIKLAELEKVVPKANLYNLR